MTCLGKTAGLTSIWFTVLLLAVAGCTTPPPQTQTQAQTQTGLHLAKTSFADLPQWSGVDQGKAQLSFQRSCAVLMAKSGDTVLAGMGYAGAVADWRGVCDMAKSGAGDFFERNFTPFAVGGEALFTGYYEPQIRGSRARTGAFQTPVYGSPSDLVRADLGLFNPKLKGERISGKVEGRALVPYADRAQIDTGGIATAPTLFYTDDPVAFFFLQIQGSGRVVFEDGNTTRIAYAGENGQAYTAIGRTLIAEGSLTREEVSLQSIRAWLMAHPDRARAVMQTNRSYIFFSEVPMGDPALGSTGSLGTNLTPLASLAVDSRIHALGAPFYVAADGPDPVHEVMVAQDIGGAIRGAARGDMFFGFGAEAERRAGAMKAPGRLYLLLPNGLAEKIGAGHDYSP